MDADESELQVAATMFNDIKYTPPHLRLKAFIAGSKRVIDYLRSRRRENRNYFLEMFVGISVENGYSPADLGFSPDEFGRFAEEAAIILAAKMVSDAKYSHSKIASIVGAANITDGARRRISDIMKGIVECSVIE